MMAKHLTWAGHSLVRLYGEGVSGATPERQLTGILDGFERELRALGLALENAVRHRIWTRTRPARDASNDVRASLITGSRRCATSSFISEDIFVSGGDVAIELIAQHPSPSNRRRLVDFDPPRRYAHYLVQDGLLFLSGMAESGATLDQQFTNAFGEVTRAMKMENISWENVLSSSLFIERGHGGPAWLIERLRGAMPLTLPYLECVEVDGLASTDKHLEIEITATLAG